MTKHLLVSIFTFFALSGLASARDFQICSSYKRENVYVSYGYKFQRQWHSQGWFMVRSGRCLPFAAPINNGLFYYFAYNQDKSIQYAGEQPFCVDSKPFRVSLTRPSEDNCANEGLMIRLFKSFPLESGVTETRLILEPPKGPEVDPIPYSRASRSQLKYWSSQGDANAQAELDRRQTKKLPQEAPSPHTKDDLQERPDGSYKDDGAFEVR